MIRLGRAWDRGYACYWRTVDRQITAQNRVLVGLAPGPADAADGAQSTSAVSPSERARLMQRYREYHRTGDPEINLDEDGEGDEEEVQDDEEEEGGEEVGVCGSPGCSHAEQLARRLSRQGLQSLQPLEEESDDEEEEDGEALTGRGPRPLLQTEPEPEPEPVLLPKPRLERLTFREPLDDQEDSESSAGLAPPLSPNAALAQLVEATAASHNSGGEKEIASLSAAVRAFSALGPTGARLPKAPELLGAAQSRLRQLRREAAVAQAEAEAAAAAAERAAVRPRTPLADGRAVVEPGHLLRCLRNH